MVWLWLVQQKTMRLIWQVYIYFLSLSSRAVSALPFSETRTSCSTWKNKHFPFLCFLHNALYTLQYCAILFLCFFRCLYEAPIQIKATAALSNYECQHKLHLEKGPEGTCESPPVPEVRVSRSVTGRWASQWPGLVSPWTEIVFLWTRTKESWRD